jgi:perosamine synthetase
MTQLSDDLTLTAPGPAPDPPALTDDEIAAAVGVLRAGRLGGPDHPEVLAFEQALAVDSAVRHAVVVNSGTAALHCILAGLGIGSGDEVIVPAHTFIATATPVLMTGATPVVVDVDPVTYCIDPAAVAAARTARTRAVIAVHLNGHPAPVDQLPDDLPLISDACQAHGAKLFGRPVGGLGVAAAFSFWQDKLVTAAGEGGAALTSDDELAETLRLIRSHGQAPIGAGPDSHHVLLGHNYRLTAVQAVVGRSQLRRLPDTLPGRRLRAAELSRQLADVPGLTLPAERPGAAHVFWKYVPRLEPGVLRGDRGGLLAELGAAGVAAAPRYPVPLTRQPVLSGTARLLPTPVSDALAGELFTIPLPPTVAGVGELADRVRRAVLALRR